MNLIGDARLDLREQQNALNDLVNTYSGDYDSVLSSVDQLDSNVNALNVYNDQYLGISFFADLKVQYDDLMNRMNSDSDLSNLDQSVSNYKTEADQAIEDINSYLRTLSDLSTTWNNLELEVIRVMNDPDGTVEQLLEIQTRFPDMNLPPAPDTQPVFVFYDLLQMYLTETSALKRTIGERISFYDHATKIVSF